MKKILKMVVITSIYFLLNLTVLSSLLTANNNIQIVSENSFDTLLDSYQNTMQEKVYLKKQLITQLVPNKNQEKNSDTFQVDLPYVPGELLIKFKDNMQPKNIIQTETGGIQTDNPTLNLLNEKQHATSVQKMRYQHTDSDTFYKIVFPETTDIPQIATEYMKDSSVEIAQPNYKMELNQIPNDPYYSSSGSWGQDFQDMYGLHLIDAERAWDFSTGNQNIVVAVIDSDVDYTHPEIFPNMWINRNEIPGNDMDDDSDGFTDNLYGADFGDCGGGTCGDGDPMDELGHGTHCAGIIGAVGNNASGITGVNWKIKIMAVKISGTCGTFTSDIAHVAIDWAVAHGADVLSCSWGPKFRVENDAYLNIAIDDAYNAGCVIVFAAGNNNDDVQYYSPTNNPHVIAVAATDHTDKKASFSNWGSQIAVSAPGVDILSLRAANTDMYTGSIGYEPGENFIPPFDIGAEYYRSSGTSMACPYVAGVAALILSQNSGLSNDEVKNRLITLSDNIDSVNPGYEGLLGSGRINMFRALPIPHNLGILSCTTPTHIQSPESISVAVTVYNSGVHEEYNVPIQLYADNILVGTEQITIFEQNSKQEVIFSWVPQGLGVYTLKTVIGKITKTQNAGEQYFEDNIQTFSLIVGVYNKDSGKCFSTIQNAINDPDTADGDTILVPSGTYPEHVYITSKNVALVGEDQAITSIEGCGLDEPIITLVNRTAVSISGFTITDGSHGIFISGSLDITITKTRITNNLENGIMFVSSQNNIIIENEIVDNPLGVTIDSDSSQNLLYHNHLCNTQNAIDNGIANHWNSEYYSDDNIHPSGGNYWSDYSGVDEKNGPHQDESWTGSDGIGDSSYDNIDGTSENLDMYPLMKPWNGPLPGTIYVDDDAPSGGNGQLESPYHFIQDAVNTATIEGDAVFVFDGAYEEPVQIFTPGLRLLAQENSQTTIQSSQDGQYILSLNADGIIVNGFTLKGMNEMNIGIFGYHKNYTISNNTIISTEGGGIYFKDTSFTKITNNIFRSQILAIGLEGFCNNNTITGNTFMICTVPVFSCNIYLYLYNSPQGNNISGNRIDNNAEFGIFVRCVDTYPIKDTIISDNTISQTRTYGIVAEGKLRNIQIKNNTIQYTTMGITLIPPLINAVVTKNTVTHCSSNLPDEYYGSGIYLTTYENLPCDVIISNNNISNNRNGFYANKTSEWIVEPNVLIYHNNFISNQIIFDKIGCRWNESYPEGGNYWSDFDSESEEAYDDFSGSIQNIPGPDDIVDLGELYGGGLNPYTNILHGINPDWYPLKNPLYPFSAEALGPSKSLVNESVTFNGYASGGFSYYTWLWDFGDGFYSENQNPSHIYNRTGNYTVILTVTDCRGFSTIDTLSIEIKIIIAVPNGPYTGFITSPIQFEGTVLGGTAPYSWKWMFGDPEQHSSSEQNPMFQYSEGGNYSATLTVTDAFGYNDTEIAQVSIASVIWVDDDFNASTPGWGSTHFNKIQDGIDAVTVGGIVYVYKGTYIDVFDIYKKIILIGENKNSTIISSSPWSIEISANEVSITNLTIQRSIVIYGDCNIIKDNIITDGIFISHSTNNTIKKNNIDCMYTCYSNIEISGSNNIIIENNILHARYYNIFLCDASFNSIINNTITNCLSTAMFFQLNVFNNTIKGNMIADNSGTGIFLYSRCNSNIILENTFLRNNFCLYLAFDSNNNIIYHNNMIDNQESVVDFCQNIYTLSYPLGGNYWSNFDSSEEGAYDDFSGPNQDEPNPDGLSDIPYSIPCGSNYDFYPFMNQNGWG